MSTFDSCVIGGCSWGISEILCLIFLVTSCHGGPRGPEYGLWHPFLVEHGEMNRMRNEAKSWGILMANADMSEDAAPNLDQQTSKDVSSKEAIRFDI